MALTAHTIPTIVGQAILESLKANLVYGSMFNQDYLGDVAPGNIVKIPSIGSVTVDDYVRYTDMAEEAVTDASQSMSIDQQKFFNLVIDDIDAAMAKPQIMAAYANEAAYALRDEVDKYLASILAAGTLTTDLGDDTTPLDIGGAATAEGMFTQMAVLLDQAKVPRQGRYAIIPPWLNKHLVTNAILNFSDTMSVAQDGLVGRYAGFDILLSWNVPNTASAKYKIVAGSRIAATNAIAINKTEVLRHESQFADKFRGLAVYGAKLTRADKVAVATVDPA